MASIRTPGHCGLAVVLLALAATPVLAQRPAVTVGVGTGLSSLPSRGPDPQAGRLHSMLVVGVAPARWPVELRADVMWAHWASFAGPVSATANVVLPFGTITLDDRARVRPYVLAGTGYYGVGGVSPQMGVNAGAGARLELPRIAAFVEGRRHGRYQRTFLTLGVALRR
jgi:hypothetical protein